jgi:hypothetical protein
MRQAKRDRQQARPKTNWSAWLYLGMVAGAIVVARNVTAADALLP